MRARRFMPSLNLLMAFDAVIRHGSVTAAADELALTQSAVSRLVQTLEAQLGCILFLRERKRLVPTASALGYQRDIARALDMIQSASMNVVTNPKGGTLSLAVLPTFATRWLGPRLAPFLTAHPGISVTLSTRIQRFDFDTSPFDAVIFYGMPDWPRADHLELFPERLTACAAPDFLQRHPITAPGDLDALPLMHLESRIDAWSDWFRGQGAQPRTASGMRMDTFSMMVQAAISGIGVALLPDYLAQIEISEGRLHPILRPAVPAGGSYWLAWPETRRDHGPIAAFSDWMRRIALAETA
ncbi:LysR family transcriptional regulator [Paracoccus sp. (in: a-proteobacteria)]|uniref:LysR family transcriptional regulator n=1 Tax=Paracoccus sp. TaxID=267 RepID=UPI00396C8737